jgi:hypothetical protein
VGLMELSLWQNYPRMRDRGLEAYHIVSHETANTCPGHKALNQDELQLCLNFWINCVYISVFLSQETNNLVASPGNHCQLLCSLLRILVKISI